MKTAKTNQDRVEVLSKKCEYFEQLQLPSKALQCKEQMLPFMDKSNPASILSFARNIYNVSMLCITAVVSQMSGVLCKYHKMSSF